MSVLRRACATVTTTVTIAAAAVFGATSASAANTTHTLAITGFHGVVVANGHVFIAGGGNDGVLVRNLDGSADTVIDEPTPRGIAASADGSAVYVALGTTSAIAAIDTTTLTETTRYATGANTCPGTVAPLGTSIYFGDGCADNGGAVGVVDLSADTPTVHTGLATGFYNTPILAVSASLPGRIFAAETGISPSTVRSFDITQAGLTAGPTVEVGSNLQDMAVSGDGADLITASGAPYYHPAFHTSDLSLDGQFTSNTYPNAVATSPAGWVAAGVNGIYWADIYMFDPDRKLTRSYELGDSSDELLPHGLAFGSGVLYAVAQHDAGFTLRVLRDATLYPTALSITAPKTAARARALSISGTLTGSGTGLGSVTLSVTKTDLAGRHLLHSVTTTGAGAFTIHDTPTVGGTNTYTVSYAGDSTRAGAAKSVKVAVSRAATSLSVSTNHTTYGYGQRQYVKAHLGATYNGRTVTVREREADSSTWHVLRTARVDSHGNLSTSFVAHRTATITASFAGDYRYAPRSITVKRAVRGVIKTAIAGTYGTSGKYHLMHQSKGGAIAAQVKPLHPGRTVLFRLQIMKNGQWRNADVARETLNEHGVIAVAFDGRTYTPLRIRAEFTGDRANAAVTAKWWYVQFR